jgi:hypothetical protein
MNNTLFILYDPNATTKWLHSHTVLLGLIHSHNVLLGLINILNSNHYQNKQIEGLSWSSSYCSWIHSYRMFGLGLRL